MTKSLTEKWKDGTLDNNLYYWNDKDIYWVARTYEMRKYLKQKCRDYIVCLAPVPSYDEYKGLLSDNLALDEATEINAELEQKVEKLQEQLKEANEILMMPDNIKYHDEVVEMLNNYSKKWGVK